MIGIIIGVGVSAIVLIIIYILIRRPKNTGYLGKTNKCISCGRITNLLVCQYCKKNSDSLR
ncbi:MAG: hypothetical protein ITD33_06680 [Nitrosarchaeum sp.]|nr:hypothetical protein [Nitrosarchaeum sp.]MBP0120521.1 hypothetical protein [Nitrosarchaeum sp.]MBP0133456.1 hypothetical protein [Nitrosarchaeum sp.]MDW7641169.1 hypothetical protein [Nitrosarchaeum sp.]